MFSSMIKDLEKREADVKKDIEMFVREGMSE